MQIRKLCVLAASLTVSLASAIFYSPGAVAVPARPANPGCGSLNYVQDGAYWDPSNGFVGGIRSPITLRTDGELCTSSDDYAADWIGIIDVGGSDVAQIGLSKIWVSGNRAYCRFWANGTGNGHFYDCTGMPGGTTVYFLVQVYNSGEDELYDIEDCGTGGDFSSCTVENATQPSFSVAAAEGIEESNYGCVTQVLGESGGEVKFGNDSWGLVGDDGSGWDKRSWVSSGTGCSNDYKVSISGDITKMWDSRNTS